MKTVFSVGCWIFLWMISLICNPVEAVPATRVAAEWEPALGVMIRWPLGIPSDLVVSMAETNHLYVLVESAGQQDQAHSQFLGWGIEPDHLEYIFTDTNTHWTRDYGPQFLITLSDWQVINQYFNGYPVESGCIVCNEGMTRYDCNGVKFCNDEPQYQMYDCIVDDGTCTDVNGDGVITDWLGDGYCDDGSFGLNFRCDELGWDCGDCGDPVIDPNGYCDDAELAQQILRTSPLAAAVRPYYRKPGRPRPASAERGWEEDDDTNIDFAAQMAWDVLDLPLYFTGGNFMTDGYGMGFATMLMVNENNLSVPTFLSIVADYLDLTDFHVLDNPNIEGIQHIDCNAKLLDAETVMVKQVDPANPEYECLEELAAYFAGLPTFYGRPFRVHRVFCPPITGGSWETSPVAAYTNSLILNRRVYVPLYGLDHDTQAVQAYQDAMPGYEVLGFHYANWYGEDALHCRAIGIFDPHMLHISHARILDSDVSPDIPIPVTAQLVDYSQSGIVTDSVRLMWRYQDQADWQTIPMTETRENGLYTATLPPPGADMIVNYYINASSEAGKNGAHPAAGWHVFSSGAAATPTPEPACLHHGDVDFNGTLTAADAQASFMIALGVFTPTIEEMCAADCNGDGVVTAGDAQQIFSAVFGGSCLDPL
jgi:agmatine/peptidylarginine deiminase